MIAKLLLPLLLLLASPVLSQEVSSSFRDFSLGINDNTTTIALKPNESPDAMNVVIDEPWGNLKTRKGTQTCGYLPSGNQATNAYEYIRSNGNHELIVTDNVTVWSTLNCTEFTEIVTGLSDLAAPYFDTFRDKLWIVNKSTFTITWDGSTAVYLDGSGTKPNPVKAQYVTHWKERVWLARTTTEPSAVYFSALTNEDGVNIDPSISSQAWPSANAFYIAQDDGSPIYGMKVFKDNLFIFKETGIWRIIFESVYNTQVVKSVSNVGCKFHDSIVELDNLLYFVGPDGIYKFDGNDVVRISDNITTTFKKLKQPSRLDKFELWDTNIDFGTGEFLDTNSELVSGDITRMDNVHLKYSTKSIVYDDFSGGIASKNWNFYGGDDRFITSNNALEYKADISDPVGYGSAYNYGVKYSTLSYEPNIGEQRVKVTAKATTNTGNSILWVGGSKSLYYFNSDSTSTVVANGYAVGIECAGNPSSIATTCSSVFYRISGGNKTELSRNTNSYGRVIPGTLSGDYQKKNCPQIEICDYRISFSDKNISITGTNTRYAPVYGGYVSVAGVDSFCSHQHAIDTPLKHNGNKIFYAERSAQSVVSGYPMHGTSGDFGNPSVDDIYVTTGGYATSGSYTSLVSTYSNLSQWRTFDVDHTLNGQSIIYSIRTGPSASSLGVFRQIVSGAVVSTSTADKVVQWKSDFTTYDTMRTPAINSVSINYREGDVTVTRLSAIDYNNRYMLTASTTPANLFNDIVLVKSKSPLDSWMVYDQTISAFTKWNTYLYGGVSNSSDVARMDYGSNDNGKAINAYWTWGDSDMGVGLSYKKTLSEIYAFYVPSLGDNTQLQYSRDGGANWNSLLLNTNTTGSFGTKRLLFNGGNANAFRFRILNNTLDESFNFLGFNAYGTQYRARE